MPRRKSKAKKLLQELQDWDNDDLEELYELLVGLLDERDAVVEEEETERPDGTPLGPHGGAGHIELKYITDRKTGKEYGPYQYLRYWEANDKGKLVLKSKYLGKLLKGDDAK